MKPMLFTVFAMFASLAAWAGGLDRVDGLGAKALGMGGAYNAVAGDGSALYYNVAGLTQAESDYVQMGTDLIFPRFNFERSDGTGLESDFSIFPMPMFMLVNRLSEKSVGTVGTYAPFGLGVDNPNDQRHGLQYQKSKLGLINLTCAVAYELVEDKLSIGAGIDIASGQLVYNSVFHQLGFGIDPVTMKTSADGYATGFGYRLGLRWQITDSLAWGLSYSSPVKVKMEGETEIALFRWPLGRDHFTTDVTFPARFGTGFEWWVGPKLKLALDANYYDYRRLGRIAFDFDHLPTISQKMLLENNYSFHLGAEEWLTKDLCVRAGLAWLKCSIPESTTNPIMADGDGWGATIGLGYTKKDWTFDLAYNYYWAKRQVEPTWNRLAPGDYKMDGHILSAAVTYRFGREKKDAAAQ
ncbi:MAG: outer membrane protein transport protein [Candidatus Buchananbacteria bacterium]